MSVAPASIEVRGLKLAYGSFTVQQDLNFSIQRGDVFIIMGPSGCGKSSLLKAMVGLLRPVAGGVCYAGEPYWAGGEPERRALSQRIGVLFQSGRIVELDDAGRERRVAAAAIAPGSAGPGSRRSARGNSRWWA
jgi:phospholipid/cholesterol/gamma-HCH transport system ATP-binding protein